MSRRAAVSRRGMPAAAAGVPAPADRRFRRSDVRPGRPRLGRLAVRAGAVLAAAALVTAAIAILSRWVVDLPFLAVDRVVVAGTTRLSGGEVGALVEGLRGQSILTVDFEVYRRRLLDSPWVASVALARRLPSTVEIRIVERVPVAIARLGQQLYLVDAEGVIIDQYGPPYADLDFPIVDGLVRSPGAGSTAVARGHGFSSIRALVRPDNEASRRTFARAGYGLVGETEVDGESALLFVYELRA